MISIDDEVLCDKCLKPVRLYGFRVEHETFCEKCAKEMNIEYLDTDDLKKKENE